MAINLLETIQQNLHYPPLQKIDPNTEEVYADEKTPNEHRFSQAAIPATLIGLYQYSSKDEGAGQILRGDSSSNWAKSLFGDFKEEAIKKISDYSFNQDRNKVEAGVNKIAEEAVNTIRQQLKPEADAMDVKKFLSGQTTNILSFLPASLRIGRLVNEETLDDNTNKMEGPISSLMHKIGSAFSNPSNEAEVNTKK